jgi:hypothetical protein
MFTVSWTTILMGLGALLVVVLYGYSISSQIKVADTGAGCSSCPKNQNENSSE